MLLIERNAARDSADDALAELWHSRRGLRKDCGGLIQIGQDFAPRIRISDSGEREGLGWGRTWSLRIRGSCCCASRCMRSETRGTSAFGPLTALSAVTISLALRARPPGPATGGPESQGCEQEPCRRTSRRLHYAPSHAERQPQDIHVVGVTVVT